MSSAGHPVSLSVRYAAARAEAVLQYERYLVAGGHWVLYTVLGWEHLAACALSHYLLENARIQSPWPYAALWLGQVVMAVSAVTLARRLTPLGRSPLQKGVDRVWLVFLLLCWNVAILNVVTGQALFVFLPVLATLSSFAFLVLTSSLSRRFLPAALVMCAVGGLMARFPAYSFLLYGAGWLVVLQALGVVFFRKRRLPAESPEGPAPVSSPSHLAAVRTARTSAPEASARVEHRGRFGHRPRC
jgi:hypothetical protein